MKYRPRVRPFDATRWEEDVTEVLDELFNHGFPARYHEAGCPIHQHNLPEHIVVDLPRGAAHKHMLIKPGEWVAIAGTSITVYKHASFIRLFEVAA